jgi:hypothetical protein
MTSCSADLLQRSDIGFGVICRRVDASVPEDQSNLVERDAVAQHLGRCGVPQDMGAFGRRNDAGSLHGAFHHRGHAVAVCE